MCFPSPKVNLLLEGECILCVRSNRQSSRHIHLETLGLSGIMFQVSGISIRYQVSGTMYQVRCIRYQVQCIRYQVLGVRYQLSGFSNRVAGEDDRVKATVAAVLDKCEALKGSMWSTWLEYLSA